MYFILVYNTVKIEYETYFCINSQKSIRFTVSFVTKRRYRNNDVIMILFILGLICDLLNILIF